MTSGFLMCRYTATYVYTNIFIEQRRINKDGPQHTLASCSLSASFLFLFVFHFFFFKYKATVCPHFKNFMPRRLAMHSYNPSIWEVDAGGTGVQGQPELYETSQKTKSPSSLYF